MKTKASAAGFLKQVLSLVMSVVKAKAMAVKSKTSAVKTRLIIFGLLRNKKVLMSAVSHKIHALLGHQMQGMKQKGQGSGGGAADVDDSKAVVLYSAVPADHEETAAADPEVAAASAGADAHHGVVMADAELSTVIHHNNGVAAEEDELLIEEEEDDDGYPDLRHSLFDEEEEEYNGLLQGDDGTGSVVELVKNLRGEEEGEFVLEDEIDHVADVFIRRFHRQMRLQKLESFKRFHDMMERSV